MQDISEGTQNDPQVADILTKAPSSRGPGHGPLKALAKKPKHQLPKERRGLKSGRPGTASGFILGEYWDVSAPRFSDKTKSRMRSLFRSMAVAFGNKPVSSLTQRDVTLWFDNLTLAPASRNKYRFYVRRMFRKARELGYLNTDAPDPSASLPRSKEPPGRRRWLMSDQRERLFSAADSVLRAYMVTSYETGARLGDCHAMQRWMVDWYGQTISREIPKTKQYHVAPITQALRALFDELGVEKMAESDYILPRMHPNSVSRAFRKLSRRVGLRDFHFHDLLGDGCTQFVIQNAHPRVAQAYRGHLDARTTAKFYEAVPLDVLREALEKRSQGKG